jgi:energy-coupling factor transport system substrate-specific component
MSWQLASFTVLGLALAAGAAWYERGRPDAKVVALVATLAALAALGRVAFAALPNVKPTTDVVFIAGYALGGGPGFAVGAIAGLTSNFFFGQGPWTPWQMAAWGATGIAGAGLARLTAGRIGRWPLAVACTICGLLFAVAQDVGDWVNFSDHSGRQLGVYVSTGLGFDVVHALGCLGFALAIGPALLRQVSRFAARLNVTWRAAGALGAGLAIILLLAPGLRTDTAAAAPTPTGYLLSAQNPDGGLGSGPGAASDPLFSGWAALGLRAAGIDPATVRRGGASLLAYLERAPLPDIGAVERTLLAAGAAGANPRGFGGRDLVAALERRIRPDGSVADQVNLTAFAVLALRAAAVPPPPGMLGWLRRQQNGDGGFSFATAGGQSDVDDTGAALEALGPGAAGHRGLHFIAAQQNDDGGLPAQPGGDSNAQSTAFAVQGLIAAGADPGTIRRHGRSALDYLHSLVAPNGHIRYARGSDQTPVWVTSQALMALSGKALPLAAPARAVAAPPPVAQPRRHRAAPVHHRPRVRHAHRTATGVRAAPARVASRLAAVAGLLAALAYAPVGI